MEVEPTTLDMKPFLFSLFCSAFAFSAFAQDKGFLLKGFLNTSYEDMHITTERGWDFARPTFGIGQELKSKWYHELELSRLLFGSKRERISPTSVEGVTTRNTDFALRYTFGRTLVQKGPWQFGLGLGVQPRFLRLKTEYDDGPPQTLNEYQLRLSIIPRLSYAIDERWRVEGSVVLNYLETYVVNEKESGRDMGDWHFPSEAITFRLGISYRFGKCD